MSSRLPPVLLGITLALTSGRARAGDVPVLSVTRADSASDCPDTEGMVQRINEVAGRTSVLAAGRAKGSMQLQVTLGSSESGYSAVIVASGTRSGTRRLADIGTRCDGLADALALTLALILDDERNHPADGVPAAPLLRPLPTNRHAPPEPAVRTHVHAGGLGTLGMFESASLGISAGVLLQLDPMMVGAGFAYLPSREFRLEEGAVDVSLTAATLQGCVQTSQQPVLVAACWKMWGGYLHGAATGFTTTRETSRPWIALGGELATLIPLAGPLEAIAALGVAVPLRRERFSIDNVGLAHTSPPLGGTLSLGLAARFD